MMKKRTLDSYGESNIVLFIFVPNQNPSKSLLLLPRESSYYLKKPYPQTDIAFSLYLIFPLGWVWEERRKLNNFFRPCRVNIDSYNTKLGSISTLKTVGKKGFFGGKIILIGGKLNGSFCCRVHLK